MRDERRSPRRGSAMLWWLLAIGLSAIVGWILFAPVPEAGDDVDRAAPPLDEPEDPQLKPAEYVAGPGGPLRGEGPLVVELHWLGGAADDRLRASRPGSMTGQVLAFDGTPAAGVRMRVVGGPEDGAGTTTGPDGRYLLEDLIPGTHYFSLQAPGGTAVVRMQRVASLRRTKRDFQIGETMEIPFLVLDHESKPLAGARVATDLGAHEAVTGEDGVARVGGVAGGQRVLVEVDAEGFVPVRYEMNLYKPLLTGEPVALPPLPQGGVVRGEVRSWPGGPLPRVTLVPRASGPGPWSVAWERWQDVEVDGRGFFELSDLPHTHTVDVRVFHPYGIGDPGVRTVRPSRNATTTLDFVIKEGKAIVEGVVRGPDREPLRGATVVLEAQRPDQVLAALYPGLDESPLAVRLPVPGALRRAIETRADGKFRFTVDDHPPGTGSMVLSASADGCMTARREVTRTSRSLELDLEPLRPDASLALVREDDGPLPPERHWLLEDAPVGDADATLLEGLSAGWYAVRVRRGDVVLLDREMELARGTRLDLSPPR